MTKFEDMINVYHSHNYPPDDYCSSMFNEEIKQLYEKNKTDIFNYYEPRVLAGKLADINNDTVKITDSNNNLYNWRLEIKTSKITFAVSSGVLTNSYNRTEARPDLYHIQYASKIRKQLPLDHFGSSTFKFDIHQISDTMTEYLKSEVNKDLNKLSIPSEVYSCDARLEFGLSNIDLILQTEIDIIIKRIPFLEDVKTMEYTIPRIMYDKMIDMNEMIKQL